MARKNFKNKAARRRHNFMEYQTLELLNDDNSMYYERWEDEWPNELFLL